MTKRDVQVLSAAGLAGWLLVGSAAAAWAQPAEPVRPTPAVAAAPTAATPAAAAASAATPLVDKTDKPADKTDKPVAAAAGTALPPGTSIKVERTARGAKLFRITEGLVVEGQMQRPNAFLVLQRATVDYDYEALSESFLPRIVAATREKPF